MPSSDDDELTTSEQISQYIAELYGFSETINYLATKISPAHSDLTAKTRFKMIAEATYGMSKSALALDSLWNSVPKKEIDASVLNTLGDRIRALSMSTAEQDS